MWWIEHGPLTGGVLGQDAWDHSGRDTLEEAVRHIKFLLNMGCVVHALTGPGNVKHMDEAEITQQFGRPRLQNSN